MSTRMDSDIRIGTPEVYGLRIATVISRQEGKKIKEELLEPKMKKNYHKKTLRKGHASPQPA